MNIIAILLLNNNIISLNNGLHYVVVYIQICGWWDADSGVCQWANEPHRQTHAQDIFLGEELEPTTAESISPRLQREAEDERIRARRMRAWDTDDDGDEAEKVDDVQQVKRSESKSAPSA